MYKISAGTILNSGGGDSEGAASTSEAWLGASASSSAGHSKLGQHRAYAVGPFLACWFLSRGFPGFMFGDLERVLTCLLRLLIYY